jgi:sugar phosphate isomerase/epimerase
MQNRKEFLKRSVAATIGTLFVSKQSLNFLFEKQMTAGLQLFTLFNVMDDDVQGNLKKVAAIGYKEIESAFSKKGGFYGMKPKEFATMTKDLGLSWQSHHVLGAPFKLPPGAKMPTMPDGKPMELPKVKNLRDNCQEIMDEAAEGGFPYLVCASTPIENAQDIKESIDTLNKVGDAAKKAGINFAYHNHDREFQTVDGKVIYDRFLSETDADKVKMELDLCWVTKAGVDPVELFKKQPGRFHLWHVKDLDKEKKGPAPVGEGVIDFKRIFENAELSGMKHFFVEHDMPADPFGSITTSYNNLQKIVGA